MKAAMCLETSTDDSTLFIGGCDKMDIHEGFALITALKFDDTLEYLDSIRLSDRSMKNILKDIGIRH